jgi:crotonobetainyl-CoA:carnitine CoA-transferase CaiB-like acyl-CoA transferase
MERLPLYSYRILDLTTAWAGPYGTRLLADMGAEVIKVEAVNHWDLLRALTDMPPSVELVWNKSPVFNHVNRNKYACTLDLGQPRGRELFLRLVALSDVVIESYRSPVMENLGLSYDVLRSARADIILVSMPSQGKSGPEKDFVAFGSNIEQLGGLTAISGYLGGGPQKTGISYGDPVSGIAAAAAVALALWHRRRTGEGQYVEVVQWENMVGLIGEYVVGYSMNGRLPQPMGNRHSSMAPHGCYPCAGDDQWVTIAVEDDGQFAALCRIMGRPELAADPRFADVVSRYRNQDELDAIVEEWTRRLTPQAVTEALQAAGIPAAPVLGVPALFDDPHLRARGFWETVSHPDAGTWDMDGVPWRMSRSPAHVRLPAPRFAEHNDYVLRGLLGLSEEEIRELAAAGVIGDRPNPGVHV